MTWRARRAASQTDRPTHAASRAARAFGAVQTGARQTHRLAAYDCQTPAPYRWRANLARVPGAGADTVAVRAAPGVAAAAVRSCSAADPADVQTPLVVPPGDVPYHLLLLYVGV